MKTVRYRSPFIPAEWIAAHGFRPRRGIPDGDGARGPVPDAEGVCPYMRRFINTARATDAAAIVLTTMCDQVRRGRDLLDGDNRVFLLNLPATCRSAAATELYVAELRRLGDFLAQIGGTAPTREQLAAIMTAADAARAPHRAAPAGGGIPIAVVGGPLAAADRRIMQLVGDCGGRIVLDGTEAGERTLPAPFDAAAAAADPLAEMARAYFDSIPDAFRRPDTDLHRWLAEHIRQRRPHGVIVIRQVWCDLWRAEVHRMRDDCDIPLLDLDVDGEDLSTRTRTRVEAFMETLA